MGFIWVSPRSYEQYYLPLNASAAMLGGYSFYLYARRWHADRDKTRWIVVGLLSLILMVALSWHIFFGVWHSPHSGAKQAAPYRGYLPRYQEVAKRQGAYPWQLVGDYIKERTDPNDTIYVWGWIPGIYVEAQRMCPAPKAFEGNMHTLSPEELSGRVQGLLDAFDKNPPKYIVDTLKIHFPWDRPVLELWPSTQNAFRLLQYTGRLPADRNLWQQALMQTYGIQPSDLTSNGFLRADRPAALERFEQGYTQLLATRWPDEARRFEAMKPFRRYVMENYQIVTRLVQQVGGQHVVFVRK
jgi:hypothetical protein